jgi:hypothetical protein
MRPADRFPSEPRLITDRIVQAGSISGIVQNWLYREHKNAALRCSQRGTRIVP